MAPKIAIPQMGNDLFRKYMKSKYESSLKRAGAEVLWIELENLDQAVAEMLACDGLLLPGGADVNPALYGQEATEKCGKPNTLRDNAEMKMLESFLETKKPIFCICRGAQLLNVFCGGTLYQDIKELQKCKHSDFLSKNKGTHQVQIMENTKLSACMENDVAIVNSLHHQAIEKIAEGLKVAAMSEDGFVEAVEMVDYPYCVGVQWHPEHMSKRNEKQQRLFDMFVKACAVKN